MKICLFVCLIICLSIIENILSNQIVKQIFLKRFCGGHKLVDINFSIAIFFVLLYFE